MIKYVFTLVLIKLCLFSSLFAQNTELAINTGHTENVLKACFSPNGKYILTGGLDKVMKLWDVRSGQCIRTFDGQNTSVFSFAFSPDGKWIVSGGGPSENPNFISTMKLWEVETGKCVRIFQDKTDPVLDLCFTSDGQNVISGDWQKNVEYWSITDGKRSKYVGGHTYDVKKICLSPDKTTFLSAGGSFGTSGDIKIWDYSKGSFIKLISTSMDVTSACYSADGKLIFAGQSNGELLCWDIASGSLKKSFETIKYSVLSVCASADGNYLAYCGGKLDTNKGVFGIIKVWDLVKNIPVLSLESPTVVRAVDFSNDSKTLMFCGIDGKIGLYDLSAKKIIKEISGNVPQINVVKISPNGKYLAVGGGEHFSNSGVLKIWDLDLLQCTKTLSNTPDYIRSIDISPDGKYLIAGGGNWYNKRMHDIQSWNLETGQFLKAFKGHGGMISSIAFSSDGKKLVSGSEDQTVKLWDFNSGSCEKTFTNPLFLLSSGVSAVSISSDGEKLLGGYRDRILLWDVKTEKQLKIFDVYGGSANNLYFLPDNKSFYSKSTYGLGVLQWKLKSEKKYANLYEGKTDEYSKFSVSNDNKLIACGVLDKSILLWDVESKQPVKKFISHTDFVNSVCFSPDNKFIVSGSKDGTIKIWDLTAEKLLATMIVSANSDEWLIYTPEGYWDGSKNCSDYVSMVRGMDVWKIDQFAIKNNRPDIIMNRLFPEKKELISHYYNQFKKRLKKLNFTEEQLEQGYHAPEAKIVSAIQDRKKVDLQIELTDSQFNLISYNIFVNDVPIYGKGKNISNKMVILKDRIELSSGSNKIEVSCLNEKGVESIRALTYADYSLSTSKDLYFLAFGVSKYQNPAYNLAYADKDAIDLSKVIEIYKGKGFENVYTKVLTNQQVTPDAIKASKDFVKNAKPDDTFILFIAGHGMHEGCRSNILLPY